VRRSLQKPLLAALALAYAPTAARAQQPPIPPVGEPPGPSPQEQAAIEEQVKQAYLQQHKDELWKQAVSEVEQERKSAWEQRGRDQIPPAVLARTPGLEMNISGRASSVFNNYLGLGMGSALKLRMKKSWGLDAAGGIFSFRDFSSTAAPTSSFAAPFAEVSAFAWWTSRAPKGYTDADHGLLRAGMQLTFPWNSPNLPAVYLAPFAALGGSFAIGQFGKSKSYAAIVFESRLSYRIGLGSSASSPIEGWALDTTAGPAVGF
jgi:hypothetical protein